MLFYHFDMLDNFIKSDLIYHLKIERETIKEMINLYDNKKNTLLSITNNMLEIADFIDKNKLESFHDTVSLLKQLFEAVNSIHELASKLEVDLTSTISLYDKSIENNQDEIKANLVEYNKQRDELSRSIIEFEKLNTSVLNTVIEFSLAYSSSKKMKTQPFSRDNLLNKKDKLKVDIELEPHDNDVLVISEKEQKAYLPFFYSEVQELFKNSCGQYPTLQDVVDNLYVVGLERFKNSAISRFKESFHLIRNKEKGSITKALDLALELMFKSELNPIVIAACRNLDELDIYLDCLDKNELDDFTCFSIKFEIMPHLTNKNKKNTF